MDEALVERWNATVAPGDTVWHLGDFAVRVAARPRRRPPRRACTAPSTWSPATTTRLRSAPCPAGPASATTPSSTSTAAASSSATTRCAPGTASTAAPSQLHGHSHGRLKPLPRQVDVGVDAWDFRPVSLDEILAKAVRPRAKRADPT